MARAQGFQRLVCPRATPPRQPSCPASMSWVQPTRLGGLLDAGRSQLRPPSPLCRSTGGSAPDLQEVRGQARARRALEVAAAGGHNLLLVGSPGCGKTMLAARMPGILPSLCFDEAVDITRVYSAAGLLPAGNGLLCQRPFRAPHHSITAAGMVGTATLQPGEVSLAHHGVLFLDEVAEFRRSVLELLRGPLEDGPCAWAPLAARFFRRTCPWSPQRTPVHVATLVTRPGRAHAALPRWTGTAHDSAGP